MFGFQNQFVQTELVFPSLDPFQKYTAAVGKSGPLPKNQAACQQTTLEQDFSSWPCVALLTVWQQSIGGPTWGIRSYPFRWRRPSSGKISSCANSLLPSPEIQRNDKFKNNSHAPQRQTKTVDEITRTTLNEHLQDIQILRCQMHLRHRVGHQPQPTPTWNTAQLSQTIRHFENENLRWKCIQAGLSAALTFSLAHHKVMYDCGSWHGPPLC